MYGVDEIPLFGNLNIPYKCQIYWSLIFLNLRMNFFGLMNFQAPYLPWVLCGFSVLLGGSSTVDLMGKMLRNGGKS